MSGHISKIRQAIDVAAYALAVIFDAQEMDAFLLAASERDVASLGIDAVLHEFSDGLERVTLRQRDNADRVPVVANAQLAFMGWSLCAHSGKELVPATGFEPVRCYSLEPESSASANSATRA